MAFQFEWTVNIGHVITLFLALGAAYAWALNLKHGQRVMEFKLTAIDKWIDAHDAALKENLVVFQELRIQVGIMAAEIGKFSEVVKAMRR